MLRISSHDDADAKSLLPQISKYTEMAEMMKLPFWIFTEDSNPIGVLTVGKEPLQLLAPIGTQFALVDLTCKDQPRSILKDFASQALKLALQKKAEYVAIELALEEKDAVDSFLEADFKVLADSFIMTLQLDTKFDSSGGLRYAMAQKEEFPKWIELARKFLSGSADVVMERILRHLSEMPRNLLEMYYLSEKFYVANENEHEIGILNFSPRAGRISNIGVDPARRKQGHGRQIMLFGLNQLKDADCKHARLRVHVDNKPALMLYKSLGFEVAERRRFLIWEKREA
jgi:ribosomal protein S18 acetylase RimI-like enzyme